MKRRNFLKLVAAAVVCPKGLLKAESVTKSIVLTERTMLSGKKFATYYVDGGELTDKERKELIRKFKEAFKNTKFKIPKIRNPIYIQGIPCYYQDKLDD